MPQRNLIVAVIAALAVPCLSAGVAQATTIEVTTTEDRSEPGSCPGSQCSLREAVNVAESGDTIKLAGAVGKPAEYVLTQGSPITIGKSLTVEGNGVAATVLSGSSNIGPEHQLSRIMKVVAGTVTIEQMQLTAGSDGEDEKCLHGCNTLEANGGGALFNAGAKVVLDEVLFDSDGNAPVGGAIANEGTLEMSDVTFSRDFAGIGGALFGHGGTITANNVTFEDDGFITFDGGAVFLFAGGSASFTNSTIVGSGESLSFGGGIDNAGSTLTLTNDTLADNVRGSLETDQGARTIAQNTIIASGFSDGVDFDCVAAGKGTDVDTTTAVAITEDLGNNIDQDNACGLHEDSDKLGADPRLAGIAGNGGPVPTDALLVGSPAFAGAADAACPATDARGIARVQAECDIGAFQAVFHGAPAATTAAATEVTDEGALLGATVNLDGEAGGFHFMWGTSPTELANTTSEMSAGVLSSEFGESQRLEGLQPETTYYFEAVADNASASTPAGNVLSFTTSEGPPGPPVISEVKTGSVGETTATVDFTINPEGSKTTYVVNYGTTTKYGQHTKPVEVDGTRGAQRLSETLTALKPGTTYRFDVVAINEQTGEEGVASSDAHFTTKRSPGPPAVTEVKVASTTETSVTLEFTVSPNGLETTYEVEYGPTESYGQKTPAQKISGAITAQRVKETISGLEPGHTYHFRVAASNEQAPGGVRSVDLPAATGQTGSGGGAGSSQGAGAGQQGVSAFQASTGALAALEKLPAPTLGQTANVAPVSGTVLIAFPGGAATSAASVFRAGMPVSPLAAIESLSKGLHFVPLTEARQVPIGSVLETTAGVARIVTATSSKGKLQQGDFGAGIFKLLQARKQKGLTELDIIDAHSARQVCTSVGKGARVASHLSGKVLGRLNSNAHGKFSARGQYSAATVRGTEWSVANQCNGTLTKVERGVVSVRDFRRRKTITLFTGQSYLAKAP